jgi:Arrestin (or S-antigen), C-terminal domain
MLPISDEIDETFCCWSCLTRPLTLKIFVPFSGYVPEQCIRVTININNRCGFDVSRTVLSLKKVFTFVSETPEKREWKDGKTLVKNIVAGAKNGKESKIFGVIEVPAFTLPTNDDISEIVKVSYVVQVSLDVVGFVQSPKVELPIVIGSKPLKFENKIRY